MVLKNMLLLFAIVLLSGGLLQNCTESMTEPVDSGRTALTLQKPGDIIGKDMATGTVEIVWKGGNGGNPEVEPKLAFAEITAHAAYGDQLVKGEFIYQVMSVDLIPKREIIAEVHKVFVQAPNTWAVAKVISDSKGCSGDGETAEGHSADCPGSITGGPDSGHDEGCGGEDDGGCSGDDHSGGDTGGSGGGCGDDTGGTDGGCGEDHTDGSDCGGDHTDGTVTGETTVDGGTEGGCGEDHTDGDTDGGCSGDDTGGPGGSGGSGDKPKGNSCRYAQRVFIMVYDGGEPGTNGDAIAWKWFYKDSSNKPTFPGPTHPDPVSVLEAWHLCAKTIIGGNLLVHDN